MNGDMSFGERKGRVEDNSVMAMMLMSWVLAWLWGKIEGPTSTGL